MTPHLGGGVGSVLLNWIQFDKTNIHSVATLDYANEKSKKLSKEKGFELFSDMHKNTPELLKLISGADIILVHFWNHPLLYDFLVRNELPASRIVFWSHVSGFTPPYIFTEKALNFPDKFVFTTPLSFETKEVKNIKDKKRFDTIWSTGGVEEIKTLKPKKHKGFNIGYIGTVDYSKMHPDFLKICDSINIPDVKFIVCGGAKHLEIEKQAKEMGIAEKFKFLGEVKDVKKHLEIFDVFGYPLNPEHYGTCEQVLQEAMAAGVVPIVLNNPAESYMLKNAKVGIVTRDFKEYKDAIEKLCSDKKLLQDLSKKSRKYAVSEYSLKKLNNDWNKIFNEIINLPKTTKNWEKENKNPSYYQIFLESLGEHQSPFLNKNLPEIKKLAALPNWQSKTKGTVHQYYEFFKTDKELEQLSKLMK